MRYFSINYVAKLTEIRFNEPSISSVAGEFLIISENFPNRKNIIDKINNDYPPPIRVTDVSVTHKFEFKSDSDFISYALSQKEKLTPELESFINACPIMPLCDFVNAFFTELTLHDNEIIKLVCDRILTSNNKLDAVCLAVDSGWWSIGSDMDPCAIILQSGDAKALNKARESSWWRVESEEQK